MTNRTLVRVKVGVGVWAWIKIYIRVLRTWNYYPKMHLCKGNGSAKSKIQNWGLKCIFGCDSQFLHVRDKVNLLFHHAAKGTGNET